MKPLVLDISDPKCDIKDLFQRFINQHWTKVGGPGACQEFAGKDVWNWITKLKGMRDADTNRHTWDICTNVRNLLVTAWLSAEFIKISKDQFPWTYTITDVDKWLIQD